MGSERPRMMMSDTGIRSLMGSGGDGFVKKDLGLLLREKRRLEASDRERELNLYRSGSAPPTVEGSLSAIGGLLGGEEAAVLPDILRAKKGTEEVLRSNPAYSSYYHSNVNLNPRLPPPLLSKENHRSIPKFRAGSSGLGGIGDQTKPDRAKDGGRRSLFLMQPTFSPKKEDREVAPRRAPGTGKWPDNRTGGLLGLPGIELDGQKSYGDILQC